MPTSPCHLSKTIKYTHATVELLPLLTNTDASRAPGLPSNLRPGEPSVDRARRERESQPDGPSVPGQAAARGELPAHQAPEQHLGGRPGRRHGGGGGRPARRDEQRDQPVPEGGGGAGHGWGGSWVAQTNETEKTDGGGTLQDLGPQ